MNSVASFWASVLFTATLGAQSTTTSAAVDDPTQPTRNAVETVAATYDPARLWEEPVYVQQTIAERNILLAADVQVDEWAARNGIEGYRVLSRGRRGAIVAVSMYEREWTQTRERVCGLPGVEACETALCQDIQLDVNVRAVGALPEDHTSVRLLREPSLSQILNPDQAGKSLCPTDSADNNVPVAFTSTGNSFTLPDAALPEDTDCWTLAIETACHVTKTPLAFVVPPEEPQRVLALVDGNVGPQVASAHGLRLTGDLALNAIQSRLLIFELDPSQDKRTVISQLTADPRVNAAQPDYIYRTSARYSDPYAFMSYGPRTSGALKLHDTTRGGGKLVAVIDTGADVDHPEIKDSVQIHEDFTGRGWSPDLHGTAVAGIISAKADNQEGSFGVAPEVKLALLKACHPINPGGLAARCWSSTLAQALDRAVAAGAPIVNLSLGGPPDPLVARMVRAAVANGQLLLAAAGNGGNAAKPAFPAALPEVVAVTAVDARNRGYAEATVGEFIDIAAPGVDIVSPVPDRTYPALSGTSMATAHVAGVAALLLDLAPLAEASTVRATLLSSVTDLGEAGADERFGEGLIDACGAASYVTSGAVTCEDTTDD